MIFIVYRNKTDNFLTVSKILDSAGRIAPRPDQTRFSGALGSIIPWLFLLILISSVVACQPEDGNISDGSGGEQSNKLIIYSGRSESLVQPLIEIFQEESGLDVEVRYGSTSELAGVLIEEGSSSPADVFYAQDPGGLGAVEQAGLFAKLPGEILDKVPDRFVADDGDWVGISGRARTIVYNAEAITDPDRQLPATLEGFTAPEWQGRLGWAPTNGSFQAMLTGMRSIWGEEKTRSWLAAMQANEPVAYQSNSAIVAAVGAGEVDAGFVNHYYLFRFLAEEGSDFAAMNYFLPGGGPGSLIMVSGAGLLGSATHRENGLRFIRFLHSPSGQQYFADQTYEYPVLAGVPTTEGLPPLAELDALAIDIDLSEMADLSGTQDMLLDLGIID